jgi:diguanylate cyclase (GGDEF)-like protein
MDDAASIEAQADLDRENVGIAEEHDFRLVTKSGRTVWTRMNTSPIIDHTGRYQGAIALVTDITERRVLEQRLAADARQDALTGVANRTALFESLTARLASGRVVAGLYIDLDGFKIVNDSFGHAAGDEVLRAVALRLCGAVRTGDVVARVGGDEFVVVTDTLRGHDEALALGRRIRDALAQPVVYAGLQIAIGACVGITFASDCDPDTLLSEADRALYRAKRAGGGRVELLENLSTAPLRALP